MTSPPARYFGAQCRSKKYDPARHKFRVSTVEENTRNIRTIYQLIRKHRPEAQVIFSLSPVPLVATFRDMPCLSANSISKAILRVAIDNVVSEFRGSGKLHYWPSYEIVMEAFQNRWMDDRRHVKPEILDFVMMQFEKAWCTVPPKQADLDNALMKARIAEDTMIGRFGWSVQNGDPDRAEDILKTWKETGRTELVDFAERWRAAFQATASDAAEKSEEPAAGAEQGEAAEHRRVGDFARIHAAAREALQVRNAERMRRRRSWAGTGRLRPAHAEPPRSSRPAGLRSCRFGQPCVIDAALAISAPGASLYCRHARA